jgi:hypothetical protein
MVVYPCLIVGQWCGVSRVSINTTRTLGLNRHFLTMNFAEFQFSYQKTADNLKPLLLCLSSSAMLFVKIKSTTTRENSGYVGIFNGYYVS